MLRLLNGKLSKPGEKTFNHLKTEFKYEPNEGFIFEAYHRGCDQIPNQECKIWNDYMKTCVIL